jgi:hypothetical protein
MGLPRQKRARLIAGTPRGPMLLSVDEGENATVRPLAGKADAESVTRNQRKGAGKHRGPLSFCRIQEF